MNTETFYTDLDLAFNIHPSKKDLVLSNNEQAVIRSVKHLILTGFYERLFQAEIGSNVSKMLFEQNSSLLKNHLENEIYNILRIYEPRVTNVNINIEDSPDEHYLIATISFYLTTSTTLTTVDILLERVR